MAPALSRIAALPLFVALAAAGTGCRQPSASPRPAPGQRADVLTAADAASGIGALEGVGDAAPMEGPVVVGLRSVDLAVYLATPPAPALVKAAQDEARTRFPGVPVRLQPGPLDPPAALVFAPRIEDFRPPTEASMRYVARGLDAAQERAATAATGVLMVAFAFDADPTWSRLREAQKLVLEIAQKSAGFVWDESTRQIYSTSAWTDDRVQGWDGDLPDMRRHINIHYYESDGGRHRAITLGMAQFGLPDLVARDVPLNEANAMTTLLDAVAQLLVEGAGLERGRELRLDLTAIRARRVRDALVARVGPGASLRGRIDLVRTPAEQGDPENRLVELSFPSYPGPTEAERQAAAITAIVGAGDDPISGAPADDPELAAVTARVQARLPAVGKAFRAGLPLGERIVVKAPFTAEDGSVEWMWVGVTGWTGDVLRGRLENDPYRVKSLHLGAKVEVKQASIADYLWSREDGTTREGGESSEILKRRAEKTK